SPMNLEHVLCQVHADDANLSHGCPLLQLVLRHHELGTSRCRQGRAASTPSPLPKPSFSASFRQIASPLTRSETATAGLRAIERVLFTRSLRDLTASRMEPLRSPTAVSSTVTQGALPCWTFSTSSSASQFSWPSPSASVPPSGCEGAPC